MKLLVLALPFATADYDCTPSDAEVQTSGWYVVLDNCLLSDCVVSLWIYQESNGIHLLQRQDAARDDSCGLAPDTLVAGTMLLPP